MANITLRQAAAWCGGTVEEKYADVEFFGANNDTRVLQPGQLFIVLQGARDGHEFIPAAMEKGAAAVLCSRKVGDYPAIYVEDPRKALGDIAREALSLFILPLTNLSVEPDFLNSCFSSNSLVTFTASFILCSMVFMLLKNAL